MDERNRVGNAGCGCGVCEGKRGEVGIVFAPLSIFQRAKEKCEREGGCFCLN